ncbi:alanine dehydrogenase [bacterium]|nr:alanine dehydrogenase [bacterium]
MLIGVPKEIKNNEFRVSTSPAGVAELVHHGHQVIVETKAGHAIGFDDSQYQAAGAKIAASAEEVFARADMIVKVKEPQPVECKMLREGQVIFCYLHLAADPKQAELLMESKSVAIAFETVTHSDGTLPLLTPMSEVAGRLSIQAGANALEKVKGGRGVLLSGVTGVAPGKVVVIGGGVVGTNAAYVAAGMGADVVVLDKSLKRLRQLDEIFSGRIKAIYSTQAALEEHLQEADLVVGAVLIPGASAPKLIRREHLAKMKRGSVIVDVAIDQGGCTEMSKATTHAEPVYDVDGIILYCVANMPSAVARSSSQALENAILPYTLALAGKGYRTALREDAHFRNGLNVCQGRITHEAVAGALKLDYTPATVMLG